MLVLGDAHADDSEKRTALLDAYDESGADAALQVGDLGYYELPTPTWFVAGNNEDFEVIEALRAGDPPPEVENAHLLASTAVELEGVRVAGLAGNYAPTQYDRCRDELEGDRRRHFTREDVDRARDLENVHVFVTHEAPLGLHWYGYDPGSGHVNGLLESLEPDLCLVGHHHRHREAEIEDVRVVSLAPVWERYYTLEPNGLVLESHDR